MLKPTRLLFPAGRTPGVDRSHVALTGGGPLRASFIAAPGYNTATGGVINLLSGKGAAGTPGTGTISTAVDGNIGPAVLVGAVTAGNAHITLTDTANLQSGSGDSVMTMAAIVRTPASFGAVNRTIAAMSAGGYNALFTSSGGLNIGCSGTGGSSVSTSLVAAVNTPYFVAFTAVLSGHYLAVLKRLDNGQISTHTGTFSGASSTTGTTIAIGAALNNSGQFAGGIHAVAYIANLIPDQALLQWADDPWSFWYPRKRAREMIVGISSPAFLAAWASRSNLVYAGVAS